MNGCGIYHLIKTPLRNYIFDANCCKLIETDSEVYDYLSGEISMNANIKRKISYYQNSGLLLDEYPQKLEHNETQNIEYHLNNKVNSITLQLTQKCNFRCTYCIYSEDSSPYQREHSESEMSAELLKKCIDFLFSHSRDIKQVNIGFYGGEPLLRFDLIKLAVEYVSLNYYGKNVSYSITTNGSLLTDEVIEFFIEHKIYPLISFDGPKEIHDKNRHFQNNGCGTYDVILKRIENIRKKYPDFIGKLKFSTVIDPQNDLSCINNTLIEYQDNFNITSLISLLSDAYSSNRTYIPDEYVFAENDERIKSFLYILGYVQDGKISPITKNFVDSICKLSKYCQEDIFSFSLQYVPGGPCIPGTSRLMISTDGTFYPCEHVSEKSDVMKIGNIDEGFDINKVLKLLNVAQITKSSCQKCWCFHLCYQCAKFCDNVDSLSSAKRLEECHFVRNTLNTRLKTYLMFKEVMEIKNEKQENKECLRLPI